VIRQPYLPKKAMTPNPRSETDNSTLTVTYEGGSRYSISLSTGHSTKGEKDGESIPMGTTAVILENGRVIAQTLGEDSIQKAEKIVAALKFWDNHCQNTARASLIMGGF